LVVLALTLAGREIVEPSVPYQMLNDVFELETIGACEKAWKWLEKRLDELTQVCELLL